MSTREFQSSPEDSLFAALTAQLPKSTAASRSAASAEVEVLKSALAASAQVVSFTFDPVSIEDAQQTRQLNKSLHLGFSPPVASTR
jgi:hypothetical protein